VSQTGDPVTDPAETPDRPATAEGKAMAGQEATESEVAVVTTVAAGGGEVAAGGGGVAAGRAARRVLRVRYAVVAAVLFAVAGGVLQVLAARHDPATRNRALVDAETTAIVIGDVSNGLTTVFSYSPDSTDATERAAGEVLGGAALSQYRTLFAQVKEHAAAERLTVTTRVVRAGVISLTRDTARLLVFLDQIVVRKDRPRGTPAAAQLSVTARRTAGRWRVVDIHAR
jgi:Mce-associated membrane protein